MTQHELILDYVNEFGSITPMEAFSELGITKLATRIGEIERGGEITFNHTRVTRENRYGKPVTFCRYTLKENNDADIQS